MTQNIHRYMIYLLLMIAALVVSACNLGSIPEPTDNDQIIAAAVEATLTSIAVGENGADIESPLATPVPDVAANEPVETPAVAPPFNLPAPLPNWVMVEKPNAQKGSDDAAVTIVEYSDFQCPWCGRFFTDIFPNFEPLIESGQVRFVYKQFPVLGDASVVTAQLTECAGEQGDFWTMHDWLFNNPSAWKTAGSNLQNVLLDAGEELGYDREALISCSQSEATQEQIVADYEESRRYNFRGTPSFVVNGRPLYGFLPWEQFRLMIEATLAEAAGEDLPPNVVAEPTPDLTFGDEPFAVSGDPDAPVVIYEFSDYQCPFCQRFYADTKAALDEAYVETGKVYFVYKDFPIDNIHAQARKAAESAECAGEQDAYWPMHDRIYDGKTEWENQDNAIDVFKGYATELGLDQAEFDTCLDSDRYTAEVQEDLEEGRRVGVTGTPTFYINGQQVVGAQPFAVFQQAIDAALEAASE